MDSDSDSDILIEELPVGGAPAEAESSDDDIEITGGWPRAPFRRRPPAPKGAPAPPPPRAQR